MIKRKNISKKILSIFFVLLLLFEVLIPGISVGALEADLKSIEDTTVEEDLKNLNLNNYLYNPTGECEIISLMEYGYTENEKYTDVYNLYVYVYNPTCKEVSRAEGVNVMNMWVNYSAEDSSKNENVKLEYVSKSENGRFIKFKLKEPEKLLTFAKAYAAEHEGVRRYEITSLQIRQLGEELATDYEISKTYEFSGYAAMCGPDGNPESTLVCKDYGLRSIHLELIDTYYRFTTQEDGVTQDTLNSVYFEIPVKYFNEFGNLDNISAQWYERQTKPIFVTSEEGAYIALFEWRNKASTDEEKSDYRVLWNTIEEALEIEEFIYTTFGNVLYPGVEPGDTLSTSDVVPYQIYRLAVDAEIEDKIQWLFYKDAKEISDYVVTSEELKDYMRKYKNAFPDSELILAKYPKELFEPLKDYDRYGVTKYEDENGLVKKTYTVGGDGYTYVDNDENQSKWNEFWFGTKYETCNYSPIQTISEADLILSPEEFSKKYYVDINDAELFLENATAAYDNDKVPVLLRHAVTEYESWKARFDSISNTWMSDVDGYVAQQTVFLDFDVISLGFKDKDGFNDVVIGVVANPIDIINDITPPENMKIEEQTWWQKLMAALLLIIIIVVLIFLWPFISSLFKMIFDIAWALIKFAFGALTWLLGLPFRLLRSIFRR